MATFEYEVNGGGLSQLLPIQGSKSHASFYDYQNDQAGHGYVQSDTTTIFLYKDVGTETYTIVVTHDDGNNSDTKQVKTIFSESVESAGGYIMKDDPGDAKYYQSQARNGWTSNRTDGFMIDAAQFSDVTFQIENFEDPDLVGYPPDGDITDLRIITSNGSPPDGGGVESAGQNGEIRITVPDDINPALSAGVKPEPRKGFEVMLLETDLAHL